ncbi:MULTISPECIES: aspartate aminotransferase family protein [Vitreoscilla]|uniref:Aspartate aminotransferase family protein n=1 Tax=Vitreoscilla stercoraria TaxID=61 RepID=A0ABY4EFK7_VITST|nr:MULTISPECIES: aspartate aminotransferase family protein [Vitreoscilla]AUZ04052.2 pyridoxal phosphate-dependent aminotransferase [Vitreoscilla sp. C1]UOO93690.1 aspartate aminotransferase family protein [Vitreoscilla stercoraria]
MASQEDFLQYQAPTNPHPYLLNVEKAEGLYIYTTDGKRYMDMIAGVSVNNIGHRHPKVVDAIKCQVDQYLHVMVYGEFIQEAPVAFSKKLASMLPASLNCVYSVNSGTEANEAALKLAKRITGRSQLLAFKGSYHGNTHGSLSVSANESKKIPFKPLLPDVHFLEHNDMAALQYITEKTAGVILETVQGDAGVRVSSPEFLHALRQRCNEVGAQLIFDEIQCGMGRTGKMFAFEHSGVVPDILTLGKALGGGLPIGALVSSYENMQLFTHDPMLGHITTFGGNPVIAASALATLNVFEEDIDFVEVERLGQLLEDLISQNPEILAIRRIGMMFAFDMASAERVTKVVLKCLEEGLISFWFLSHPYSFRLSPPVNITENQIRKAADIILNAIAMTR